MKDEADYTEIGLYKIEYRPYIQPKGYRYAIKKFGTSSKWFTDILETPHLAGNQALSLILKHMTEKELQEFQIFIQTNNKEK